MFGQQYIMEDCECGFPPPNSPRLLAQNSFGFEGIASSMLTEELNYEENFQSKELALARNIIQETEIQFSVIKEKYVDVKLENVELRKMNEQKDLEIVKLRKNLNVSNSKLSEYVELKPYIPYPEVCCNDVNSTSNKPTEQKTSPPVCQSQERALYCQCKDQSQNNYDSHNLSYSDRKLTSAEETRNMKLEEENKELRRQLEELRAFHNQKEEAKARIKTILKKNENDEDFDTGNMESTNSDGKCATERDTGCPKTAGNPQYNKQISLDSHTFNISCRDFRYQCHSTVSYDRGCRDPNSS